jgi:hypothetical protein
VAEAGEADNLIQLETLQHQLQEKLTLAAVVVEELGITQTHKQLTLGTALLAVAELLLLHTQAHIQTLALLVEDLHTP